MEEKSFLIDEKYVKKKLEKIVSKLDLAKYVL